MNYGQIIKRAYEIIKTRRFLWWLGILAALTGGTGINLPSFNFYNFGGSSYEKESSNAGKVLGESATKCSDFMATYWPLILLSIFLFIFIFLLILWLSYSARAGLIFSVREIEEKKKAQNFKTAFKCGERFALKLFLLNLLITLFILLAIIFFGAPILLVFFAGINTASIIFAAIWGILAVIIIIILAVYLGLISIISERFLVLNQARVIESFKSAHQILRKNFGEVLLLWLINVGISLVFAFVSGIALVIIIGILVGLGFLIYYLAHTFGLIIYGSIFGLTLIILLFIISGIYFSFISSYWTLAFLALKKEG